MSFLEQLVAELKEIGRQLERTTDLDELAALYRRANGIFARFKRVEDHGRDTIVMTPYQPYEP